jgi:hypothetical protein
MVRAVRDGSKEQFWRQVLARWQTSGLTVRAYCETHSLSQASFYCVRPPNHVPPPATRLLGETQSRTPLAATVRSTPFSSGPGDAPSDARSIGP